MAIYTESMFEDGAVDSKAIENYQSYIYHFHCEENVLAETLNVAHGIPRFRGTQFERR